MSDAYQPEFPSGAGAGRAREPNPERSTVDVIKDIVANVQEIIRSEFRLARAEMTQKARSASRAVIMIAAGAIVGLYALAFILVCIYNALSYAIWPWLSALIIGVVLGIIGGGTLLAGRRLLKQVNPTPERTVQSVKEDVEWIKNQTR